MKAGGEPTGERRVVYCIVPRELAAKLHESLRRHFADDPSISVIVERRGGERRRRDERRAGDERPVCAERRRVRNPAGRRVADRRSPGAAVPTPRSLPRRARPYAERLLFLERVEPSSQHAEDQDTARAVIRFQSGDSDAFAEIYLRYFARVYAYLKVVLSDPHEAEDGTQQIFANVLEALPRYEQRGMPFRAWLFTVVRNVALTSFQKQSRVDVVDPVELSRRNQDPRRSEEEVHALSWINDRELLLFVERLPAAQRQVIVLRYMLGLSAGEIAQVLHRSPESVRMLHSRGLRFLRERLTAIGRAPERHERSRWRRPLAPQARVVRVRRFSLIDSGPTG